MRVLFGAASLMAVVGMLWGSVTPARACSCVSTTASPYDRADTVVIGTVVRMVRSEASSAPGVPWQDLDAVIAVEEYLKDTGPSEILADDSGGTCGFFDESSAGRRYVVHLTGPPNAFRTGYCSGNYELARPAEGIGRPTPTVISADPPLERPPDPPGWGATAAPPTNFGDGTPAPGPMAGRFDGGNGDAATSEDAFAPLDEESGIGLLPAGTLVVLGPLAFLAGAAFLWRRRRRQRMGSE